MGGGRDTQFCPQPSQESGSRDKLTVSLSCSNRLGLTQLSAKQLDWPLLGRPSLNTLLGHPSRKAQPITNRCTHHTRNARATSLVLFGALSCIGHPRLPLRRTILLCRILFLDCPSNITMAIGHVDTNVQFCAIYSLCMDCLLFHFTGG